MKILGIRREYIHKPTPVDNRDIESFHNTIKKDYIWLYEFRDFHEASIEIEKAFTDYDECRPHSSIDYLPPREFRNRFEKKEVKLTLDEN